VHTSNAQVLSPGFAPSPAIARSRSTSRRGGSPAQHEPEELGRDLIVLPVGGSGEGASSSAAIRSMNRLSACSQSAWWRASCARRSRRRRRIAGPDDRFGDEATLGEGDSDHAFFPEPEQMISV
jgi:hypothetical protein